MDEIYRKLIEEKRTGFYNSVWFYTLECGSPYVQSTICLASFQPKRYKHLRWCIDRFSDKDNYQSSIIVRGKYDFSLQEKAAREVIAESFLSDVFLNRDEDYFKNGLIVDLSRPTGAMWAAMVQTRIFYEFPDTAVRYYAFRERGFSVDQSVFFCQLFDIAADNLIANKIVGSHGTCVGYGYHSVSLLKKYFNRKWEYINGLTYGTEGSCNFSRATFVRAPDKQLEDFFRVSDLFNRFNGEHDV